MLKTIETYLALRRATGFAMLNTEYLLKSFAAFATERGQTYVHTQTAIDWAAHGPSVAQRDARLKAVCRFVRHVRVEDALVREWTAIRAFILVPPVTSSEQRLAYPNSSFD